MLDFLKNNRAWLPSKKGPKVRRDLAETEIRRWQVDKGLASPSVLTTQIAYKLQNIYNTMPDLSECESQNNSSKWIKLGPIRLSWIAQYATRPIDLDDDKHILVVREEDGTKCWSIENKQGGSISSFEESSLIRSIDKRGNICEGQVSKTGTYFQRQLTDKDTTNLGYMVLKPCKECCGNCHEVFHGPIMMMLANGCVSKGEYRLGKPVKGLPDLNFD